MVQTWERVGMQLMHCFKQSQGMACPICTSAQPWTPSPARTVPRNPAQLAHCHPLDTAEQPLQETLSYQRLIILYGKHSHISTAAALAAPVFRAREINAGTSHSHNTIACKPVLGPSHQCAHVQGNEACVLQALRHITTRDALSQPLHTRSLADACTHRQDLLS